MCMASIARELMSSLKEVKRVLWDIERWEDGFRNGKCISNFKVFGYLPAANQIIVGSAEI